MIEVEKKFQPTKEQLENLLEGAIFLKEKSIHDVYYDFADFRLFKKDLRLRIRNSGFELKVYKPETNGRPRIADEYTSDDDIKKVLNISNEDLEKFVLDNMRVVCDFNTNRREYNKEGFTIDIDTTDFGFGVVEIEFLVENESDINMAEQKILNFAEKFKLKAVDLPLKTEAYLMEVYPEVYRKIYGDKEKFV